jgi:hypothetical protein
VTALAKISFMKTNIQKLVQKLVEVGSSRILQYVTIHLPILIKKKKVQDKKYFDIQRTVHRDIFL